MFNIFKKFFGCNHIYGMIQNDGFQYCKLCGKASIAPRYETCVHKWQIERILTSNSRYSDVVLKYIYILKCVHCGEMKKEEF